MRQLVVIVLRVGLTCMLTAFVADDGNGAEHLDDAIGISFALQIFFELFFGAMDAVFSVMSGSGRVG